MNVKLATFLIFLFSAAVNAQIIVPGDTILHVFNSTGQSTSNALIQTSSDTITLQWRIIYDDVKTEWPDDIALADCNTLNTVYPSMGTCHHSVNKDEPALFRLYVDPKGNKVVRYLTFELLNVNNPMDRDTFTFKTLPFPTSIESVVHSKDDVNLYPNPSNGEFTLQLHDANHTNLIRIMDLNGRLLYEQLLSSASIQKINLHELPKGVYVMHGIGNGFHWQKRLLIYD